MAYSLTNTTKRKSSGSSSSRGSKGGQSITVTRSEREAKRNGSSGGSVSSGNTTSRTNTTGVTYDPNVDYAAEIQKAVQSGASQSYIDSLNAQRNAKIKGEGLSYGSLTSGDIANYRNQASINRGDYVIGQDGGNRYTYNPSDEQISGLATSLQYDPNNPRGYADPSGYYTTRQTAFTWKQPDGTYKTTYSNATNYHQALQDAIDAGQIASGSSLARADTYGTGSLTGDGYNYGVTSTGNGGFSGFGNGYEGGRYTSDNQYGHAYDMNNMQLQFLSGRDGKLMGPDGKEYDYSNPYSIYAYNGNGMTNAYNAGAQFAGQGGIMGAYGVEGPNMDDVYANMNYGNPTTGFDSGYVGLTADDIQNQMDDVYAQYMDAIASRNAALTSYYDNQRAQLESQNEETQKANYVNYMLSQLNMPAQLQAAGINGGVAESTLAGLNSDYMTNYNNAANALTDAVTQLDIARQQAISDGDMEAANMYSQLAQNSLSLQMQAAQAENAYNQWVQEMAFAQNQWEYEQARYNAELAYQQSLAAQEAERQDKENLIAYAQTVGDWNLYGSLTGTDTSYMSALQAAELADLYNTGSSRRSRSSGGSSRGSSRGSTGGNSYDTSINNLLGGTPSLNNTVYGPQQWNGGSSADITQLIDPSTVLRANGTTTPRNNGKVFFNVR